MRPWQEQGKKLLERMPIKGRRVLDAGCGDGWASIWLQEKGALVTALDVLDKSNGKLTVLLKKNILYVASLAGLKDYDFVWCHHVLEHIQNPIEFLYGLRCVGKQLWLVVPKAVIERFAKDHINNYNMPVLIEHLRRGGWDIEHGSYNTYPRPLGCLWAVVERLDGFEKGKEITYSKYPPPMDVFNHPGENHLKTEIFSWNWGRIEGMK